VGETGRMHCALGCAVDDTLPRPVLEHWGSHVALAILLLSAPVVPFTVHWDFDGECHNTELLAFLRSLLASRDEAGSPVRFISAPAVLVPPLFHTGRPVTADELLRVCDKPFLTPGLSGGRIWVPWVLSAKLFRSSDQPPFLFFF
jgi:hypothetical protein